MKILKKSFSILSGSVVILILFATNASAQLTNPVIGTLGSDPEAAKSGSSFASYFVNLWNSIIAIGAIAVLIFFLWGAVEWISSGGDKGKVEAARNRITQAIIGLIILVSSYVIIGFISSLFFGENFNILQPNLPNILE